MVKNCCTTNKQGNSYISISNETTIFVVFFWPHECLLPRFTRSILYVLVTCYLPRRAHWNTDADVSATYRAKSAVSSFLVLYFQCAMQVHPQKLTYTIYPYHPRRLCSDCSRQIRFVSETRSVEMAECTVICAIRTDQICVFGYLSLHSSWTPHFCRSRFEEVTVCWVMSDRKHKWVTVKDTFTVNLIGESRAFRLKRIYTNLNITCEKIFICQSIAILHRFSKTQ